MLWSHGLRYRLQVRVSGVRTDFAFPGKKVAVFVDGCFWHGCPLHYSKPRTNADYWRSKLENNVARDRRQTVALERSGWRVIRVWEHEATSKDSAENAAPFLRRVLEALQADVWSPQEDWRVFRVEWTDDDMELWHLTRLRDSSATKTQLRKR